MAEPERREFESDDIVVRGSPSGFLLVMLGVLLIQVQSLVPTEGHAAGLLAVALMFSGLTVQSRRRRVAGQAGKIEVTPTHLIVKTNRRRRFALLTPREGWLTKFQTGYRVSLRVRGRRVVEAMLDEREAPELSRAAGIDPKRRVVRYPLAAAGRWNRVLRAKVWLQKRPVISLIIAIVVSVVVVWVIAVTGMAFVVHVD
jgi:hypothetical protein